MRKLVFFALLFSGLISRCAYSQPSSFEDSIASRVDQRALMAVVSKLASPSFDGRMPGSESYIRAANMMGRRFRKAGLQPAFGASYFQYADVETNKFLSTPSLKITTPDGKVHRIQHGNDFVCRGFSGSGKITAPLFFCGYGISDVNAGYNDYEGMNLQGGVAVVFKQNPSWKPDNSDFSDKLTRYKANTAKAYGASAVLFVSTPLVPSPQKPIGSIMDGPGVNDPDFPQLHLSLDVADLLFEGTTYDISSLQARIDSLKKPFSFPLQSKAGIKVKTRYVASTRSPNVAAILPGTDPVLRNEYIVVSAHLDHVGRQGRKLYFPGANDNASGSAAVICLAEAFAASGLPLKRSICFILYTSEEQGLNGSEFFAEHLPFDSNKIVAALNLDCIGHGDSIQVGGGKSAPGLWKMAETFDRMNGRLMVRDTWYGGGADAEALFKKGVPTLYFVSKYSYTWLHLPGDTPSTINPGVFLKIVQLAGRVTCKLAMDP